MAETTQGLTKRLDFGSDLGGLQQVDQEALIAALRGPNGQPSVEGFDRRVGEAPCCSRLCPGQLQTDACGTLLTAMLLLCRALQLLHDAAQLRFAAVQDSAAEQAEAVGEADLRRLKRQFSSLKNTFLHYEVKNEFLAGELQGSTPPKLCAARLQWVAVPDAPSRARRAARRAASR